MTILLKLYMNLLKVTDSHDLVMIYLPATKIEHIIEGQSIQ